MWDSNFQHRIYLPEITLSISQANSGLIKQEIKNHSQKLRSWAAALNPTAIAKINHNKIRGIVIKPFLSRVISSADHKDWHEHHLPW